MRHIPPLTPTSHRRHTCAATSCSDSAVTAPYAPPVVDSASFLAPPGCRMRFAFLTALGVAGLVERRPNPVNTPRLHQMNEGTASPGTAVRIESYLVLFRFLFRWLVYTT